MKNLTPENAFASASERAVFSCLERALSDEWSGAHNVKLLRGASGASADHVCCEIDLVLVHPGYGIFLGEIKGGTHVSSTHSFRQAKRCVPALERVLGACYPKGLPRGTVRAFICFPDKTRVECLGKGFPLYTLYADDVAQGAESFFLKMLLGRRAHRDYSPVRELLKNSANGLVLPVNVHRRTWRERLEQFFLRMAWHFRDKNAEAELALEPEPKSPVLPTPKKKTKQKKLSAPILALLNSPETAQRTVRLREMLAAGEDPNNCGDEGFSPLFLAIKNGHRESAEILFRAGGRVSPYFKKRVTKAFVLFEDELLSEMIAADAFAEPEEILPTLFTLANGQNLVKTYETMLRKHSREFLLGMRVKFGSEASLSLVHAAAYIGKVAILRLLAENAFPLNEIDVHGRTPLQIAEQYLREECVAFLRERS